MRERTSFDSLNDPWQRTGSASHEIALVPFGTSRAYGKVGGDARFASHRDDRVDSGADKDNAFLLELPCKVCILRHESVSRVYSLCSRDVAYLEEARDVEVRKVRRSGSEQVCFVSLWSG